jgi:hypothetical protein
MVTCAPGNREGHRSRTRPRSATSRPGRWRGEAPGGRSGHPPRSLAHCLFAASATGATGTNGTGWHSEMRTEIAAATHHQHLAILQQRCCLDGARCAQARSPEQGPDRRRTDADPELAKLAFDPHASPAEILPGKLEDERTDFRVDRWPPWPTGPAVRPLPPHELGVPAEEGRRPRPARRRNDAQVGLGRLRCTAALNIISVDGVMSGVGCT